MEIQMPIERPTRIAFGGKNFETFYVTTIGTHGITPGTEDQQPQCGGPVRSAISWRSWV